MNQSDIATHLAQHLYRCPPTYPTESSINLSIVQWMLDNNIRFVKVDHAGQQVRQADPKDGQS